MKVNLNTLKNWFKTGLKPTQTQFWNWMDSFWHKDESIPQESVDNLTHDLDHKVDKAEGKSLSSNDFTDYYAEKLSNLEPIPGSFPQSKISGLTDDLGQKVNKIEGKGLSANDFTDEFKTKLIKLKRPKTIPVDSPRSIDPTDEYNNLKANSSGIKYTVPENIELSECYFFALAGCDYFVEAENENVKIIAPYGLDRFEYQTAVLIQYKPNKWAFL